MEGESLTDQELEILNNSNQETLLRAFISGGYGGGGYGGGGGGGTGGGSGEDSAGGSGGGGTNGGGGVTDTTEATRKPMDIAPLDLAPLKKLSTDVTDKDIVTQRPVPRMIKPNVPKPKVNKLPSQVPVSKKQVPPIPQFDKPWRQIIDNLRTDPEKKVSRLPVVPPILFDHHDGGKNTGVRIKNYYQVKKPITAFIEGALAIPMDVTQKSKWLADEGIIVDRTMAAMTVGSNIYFVPNTVKGYDIVQWIELIAHETSHREEYDKDGTIPFLIDYFAEYNQNKKRKMPAHKAYKNIKTEIEAYRKQDLIRAFFQNSENKATFLRILNSNLTDQEKAYLLKQLALQKIRNIFR